MNENIREESHYCTSCGAVNKKSAVFCEECNKKIVIRHRPIVDFLKKHTKSSVAGEVTERLFSLIKNFLFDHLYGAILTISVAATATIVITTSTPYIENVSETPHRETSVVTETPEEYGVFELTEDDIIWLKHVPAAYDSEIDNHLRAGETYWLDGEEYSWPTELWAENNIEGYTYSGKHELYENPLPMGQDAIDMDLYDIHEEEWMAEDFWAWHCRYAPVEGTRTGSNVRSELGHTLLADGYDVMEVDYYCLTYNGAELGELRNVYFDEALPPADKIPYEKYVYTFLLTRKHGEDKWYIAEEVLTERAGGQRG